MQYLLVYGTLLQSCNNEMSRFLEKHSEFVSKGFFCGKLYDVGEFPGAILSNDIDNKVYGRIYKLANPEDVFRVLDDYEGIDSPETNIDLFKRVRVEVFLEAGHTIKAWVYIYNLPTAHLRLIPTGRYI